MRILSSKSFSLRNALLMNDFSEIDHGEKCVLKAWGSEFGGQSARERFGALGKMLNDIHPGIVGWIMEKYDARLQKRKFETYLMSLAEYNIEAERGLGRLSMWRAYGGSNNVALLINPSDVMLRESTGAFTAPVIYRDQEDFAQNEFRLFVMKLIENQSALEDITPRQIVDYICWSLDIFAMTTKHPGFSEEREWRIIYAPWLQKDDTIQEEILTIRGVPQRLYTVSMDPEKSGVPDWRTIPRLLSGMIIGPNENPYVMKEAFCAKLEDLGIANASQIILASNIPIRR